MPLSFYDKPLSALEVLMVVKDSVCGMGVEMGSSENFVFQGKTYYFCSEECKNTFAKNPIKYIQKICEPEKS